MSLGRPSLLRLLSARLALHSCWPHSIQAPDHPRISHCTRKLHAGSADRRPTRHSGGQCRPCMQPTAVHVLVAQATGSPGLPRTPCAGSALRGCRTTRSRSAASSRTAPCGTRSMRCGLPGCCPHPSCQLAQDQIRSDQLMGSSKSHQALHASLFSSGVCS